jgi:hypothetical protein
LLQIPLDQILTTQRDVLALQHVIQRELTATHSKLQAVAGGAMSLTAAAQPPPLLPPDWSAGETWRTLLTALCAVQDKLQLLWLSRAASQLVVSLLVQQGTPSDP